MGQWMATSLTTIEDTDTYRDVRARARYHSSEGVGDSTNTFTTDGGSFFTSGSSSKTISIPFGGGDQLLFEQTVRINKTYGMTQSAYIAASITGIEYWGASQTVWDSSSMTIPARPYNLPGAPTDVSVSRNSDTSHTVTWTRQASTIAPYHSQYVQRATFVNGEWSGWQTVATLGTDHTTSGAQSWTDTSTIANRVYRYRVLARNSTGDSAPTASGLAYTTPAAPVSVAASKVGADIDIPMTTGSWASLLEVEYEHSTDGGDTWSALATVDVLPGASSEYSSAAYTHVAPNAANTHTYRVRTVVADTGADAGTGLAGAWLVSNTIQLAAPPNAPSGLSPAGPRDATEPITFSWIHNPVDTSSQSKFQIRHRADSFDPWTTEAEVESTDPEWELAADTYTNGEVPEWEVRTWGQHEDPSPWSATASFPTYARPTVAVSEPTDGTTLTDSALAVSWTYYQAESSPQYQWRATLLNGSQTLEVLSGSGYTSAAEFQTPGQDGQSYTIRVEVAASFGMWSDPDEVTVDVSYLPPAVVDVAPEWDRGAGAVAVTLTSQVWDDIATVEPIDVTVHRSSDGGRTWKLIARNVPLQGGETSIVDVTAPTRATVLYRVTSTSALPSTAVAEPVELVIDEQRLAYLGYGPGFSTVLVFYANLFLTSSVDRRSVVENFAGRTGEDGQPAGVLISGEARSRSVGVSARLVEGGQHAGREDLERAALAGGVMLYRDPTGRHMFAQMSGLYATTPVAHHTDVSFVLTEVGQAA